MIKDIGEFGLIQRIENIMGPSSEKVMKGLGDDAAAIHVENETLIVTTDTMVEDIHFRLDWNSPGNLAHKALASNLSDLAAKCAKPAFLVITMGLPPETSVAWVETFYKKLKECCTLWGIETVGGDTVRSKNIFVSIAAWGYQMTPDFVGIDGAQEGDHILVTGTLGDAAAGLSLFQKTRTPKDEVSASWLMRRFIEPTPRIKEALAISRIALPTSMTDISDGLSRDLPKICHASQKGARLDPMKLPCSDALKTLLGVDAHQWAWKGGEDYELLFTLPSQEADNLIAQWDQALCPLHVIGEVTSQGEGIQIQGGEIREQGFDHFQDY